jgi:hypothetical protein
LGSEKANREAIMFITPSNPRELCDGLIRVVGVSVSPSIPSNIDDMHSGAIFLAKDTMEGLGFMEMTWLVVCDTYPGVHILASRSSNSADKDKVVHCMKAILKKMEATMYSMISEGWLVITDKDAGIENMQPSKHPDRIEVVTIETFTKAEWRSTNFNTQRNPEVKLVDRRDVPQTAISVGRLWNLLEERTMQ